jgi:hypothetical protein
VKNNDDTHFDGAGETLLKLRNISLIPLHKCPAGRRVLSGSLEFMVNMITIKQYNEELGLV